MSTPKQEELAKEIVKNTKAKVKKNKTQLLESVGYSKKTALAEAKRTIQQKGVQDALAKMGFTKENAAKVVTEIMLDPLKDPNSRLKATDQVFKVQGSYAPEKHEHSGSISLSNLFDEANDSES